jgi:hypothetical protein
MITHPSGWSQNKNRPSPQRISRISLNGVNWQLRRARDAVHVFEGWCVEDCDGAQLADPFFVHI